MACLLQGEHGQSQTHIPEMQDMQIATCSHGWLVLVHNNRDDCFLLNPISMQKIQLPPRKPIPFNCCFLTLPPDDPNCIIVFFGIIGNHLYYFMFCKPGDIAWTKHDLELPIAEDVGVADTLECVDPFNGENLVVDGDDSSLRGGPWYGVYLVETCGELFRVDQYITHEKAVRISGWIWRRKHGSG
ncbi:hypothetical protein OIU78_021240 [Salix suchowensis]|nr:hypothetical protein OIU78_021240 [Salix suchowensis]